MDLLPGAVRRAIRSTGASGVYFDTQGERHPIVLVHGIGGTVERHFGRVVPMLANKYRVIAVDLGAVDGAGPLGIDDLAVQVRIAVDDADVSGFALVGFSLGAVVATVVAAHLGDRVESLVLVGGWLRSDAHQRLRHDLWTGLYRSNSPEYGRSSILNAFSARYLRQRTPTEIDQLVSAAVGDEWRARQMDLSSRIDVTAAAARITARTLVVAGEADAIAPLHHAHELLGAIDDARLVVLPTGHAIPTERPAQLAQVIDDHVTGRPLRAPSQTHLNAAI